MKYLRFFLFCLCLLGLYEGASRFCEARTDAFTIARIHSDLPYNAAWATPLPVGAEKEELTALLSQPFHYLGCGGQCFAFVSEDGETVIKFFKHRIRKPRSLLLFRPLPAPLEPIRLRKLNKILFKLNRDFNSYKLAYEELSQETGILYLHLNKTEGFNQTITLYDKLHIAHQIDLDQVEFIIQKKAEMAYPYLDRLIRDKQIENAERAIDSLLAVILSRCQKGIYDEDAKIHRNFGFIDGKAVVIDVGRFRGDISRIHPEVYRKDLLDITKSLHLYLEKESPELAAYLEQRLNAT